MSAVGSLTATISNNYRGPARPVTKWVLSWTCSTGGAVSGIAVGPISGEIVRVVFIPGTSGNQPSNNYSATLTLDNGDGLDDGLDLLDGLGASLSNSANTAVCPGTPLKDGTTTTTSRMACDDLLSLVIANAGNAKSGTVVLYVR